MTPLEIQIMLHYFYSGEDFRDGDFSAPAVREAIEMFKSEHMLASRLPNIEQFDRRKLCITEKGKAYVEALLKVPFPVSQWVVKYDTEHVK